MSFDAAYALSAPYYDASYGTSSRKGDIAFYAELASEMGSPVLELGCGTGRVLLPIAARGLRCTGLDASEAMLDQLRAKNAFGIECVCASMDTFEIPQRFQFIYSAFRSFQHLTTIEEQSACLRNVAKHLDVRGKLAFDVMNLQAAEKEFQPEWLSAVFRHEGMTIKRFISTIRDSASQLLHITTRFERHTPALRLPDQIVRITLRWNSRDELETLLHRSGFKHVAIFGDFTRSRWTPTSPAMVVIAS